MAEHRGSNCGEDMLRKRRDQLIWLKQKGVSSYSMKNPWRIREAKRRAGGWPRRGYRRTNRRTIGSQETGTNSEIQEMWTGRKRQKKERTDNQERFQFDIREDESLPGKNDILCQMSQEGYLEFCHLSLDRSLRKTHETMLNQTRSNVEGVKLSETLIWWNLIYRAHTCHPSRKC